MTVTNPHFETSGVVPGDAASWTVVAVSQRVRVAGFGEGPPRGREDFERWGVAWRDLGDVPLARAFFDGAHEGYDDFEEAWENSGFAVELLPAMLVGADLGEDGPDDLESGWGNGAFAQELSDAVVERGAFGPDDVESFNTWSAVLAGWPDVDAAPCRFDPAAQTRESFEGAWAGASTL